MLDINEIKNYLLSLQAKICAALAQEEGVAAFRQDSWERAGFGQGLICALSDGNSIEKAGVNFSHVQGAHLPAHASDQFPECAGHAFQALGVSLIIHPRNPYAPTTHANVRFFCTEKKGQMKVWWFGGGFDLTPYYGFDEDCVHWHKTAKQACDPFGQNLYKELKKNADDYFYLPHRNEPRGIGGLFFDNFNTLPPKTCFAFMQSVGDHFLPAYVPILKKRKDMSYDQRQRDFQLYRRGRYVEFNLLQDRGTKFGLASQGNIEGILISLPPTTTWRYNWQPLPGSPEEALYTRYLVNKDWITSP